jgi:gamma-glutamyltranspeptidase/glutathione hydrolase
MSLSRVAYFEHGVVASEHPLASFAGSEVLRHGGNAFDAAVATSFVMAVTYHPAGGLGGDFFALAYEAKRGKVHCLNSSGWAPSGLNADLLKSKGEREVPIVGPYSVMIPGTVAGMAELNRKFGSRPFGKLLAPAIGYAKKGFPAADGICRSIAANLVGMSDAAKKVFAPRGVPPSPGDWLKQEKLGKVIETIARGGAKAFYRGWPAEKIAEKLTQLGVETKKSDFSDFRPEWVEPLRLNYNGTTVYEVPPNSMGATTLFMLEQLSQTSLPKFGPLSRERMKLTLEAAEFAYQRRDEMLADPRFGPMDMEKFMRLGTTAMPAQQRKLGERDTTTFSVVDCEGNIVSVAQSLFHHFGSRVFVEDCGIMLNSRGVGFRLSGPNKVEPRKRPLHTLSCLLLDRGDGPKVALGTSGGEYRPLQHTLFVTNMVDYHMTLEQSIDHPRFLWSGGKSVEVESGYESPSPSGYDIESVPFPGRTGTCHGVEILPEARKGVCDVRGDGLPAGH